MTNVHIVCNAFASSRREGALFRFEWVHMQARKQVVIPQPICRARQEDTKKETNRQLENYTKWGAAWALEDMNMLNFFANTCDVPSTNILLNGLEGCVFPGCRVWYTTEHARNQTRLRKLRAGRWENLVTLMGGWVLRGGPLHDLGG